MHWSTIQGERPPCVRPCASSIPNQDHHLHLSAISKTPQGAHFLIERRQIVEARGGVEALGAQRLPSSITKGAFVGEGNSRVPEIYRRTVNFARIRLCPCGSGAQQGD